MDHGQTSADESDRIVDELGDVVENVVETVEDGTETAAEHVAAAIRDQPWVASLARAGWVAKGIVYGALGWAAVEIAVGDPVASDAEYTGMLAVLADDPVSRVVLVVITLGLLLYIAFRVISIALIDDGDADAWAHRIAYGFSAATYVSIAWSAAFAAVQGFTGDDDESTIEVISKALLGTGAGRVLLVVGGLGALGVSGYFTYKAVTRRFLRQVLLDSASPLEARLIGITGVIGWIGRALIVGVVAAFITWSAIDADPDDAHGIDRSLHELSDSTVGRIFVLTIAAALIVYGVYCLVSARCRCLAWDGAPEPSEAGG